MPSLDEAINKLENDLEVECEKLEAVGSRWKQGAAHIAGIPVRGLGGNSMIASWEPTVRSVRELRDRIVELKRQRGDRHIPEVNESEAEQFWDRLRAKIDAKYEELGTEVSDLEFEIDGKWHDFYDTQDEWTKNGIKQEIDPLEERKQEKEAEQMELYQERDELPY